jgi:hypothetical protein
MNEGVPCFDVVEGHDKKVELFEEVDGEFLDVFVVSDDVKIGVDFEDGLAGHKGFGVAFVLLLEEELSIEIGELGKTKGTSMVSMSMMWTWAMGSLERTLRI